MKKYKIVAICGKAGAGKDALLQALLRAYPEAHEIISYTTRPPRDYEVDGKNYHFITKEQFIQLIEEGKIFKIEKGIYSDKKDVNYLEIISKKYPNAIFTMDSAFYYHNLTDVIPEKEHLALKRDSTKISDSRIKVVYYQDKFFDIGKSTLNINGVEVKVYDKERMLIELIRNRNSIGFDYYKEIIENYREIKETLNTKKIAEYISNFAIENHLYDVIMKEVF